MESIKKTDLGIVKETVLFDELVPINGRGMFSLKIETCTEIKTKNKYKVTLNNTETSIAELVYNNDANVVEKCYSLLLEKELDSFCGFTFKNILLSGKTHSKIDKICKAISNSENYSPKHVNLYGLGLQAKSRFFFLPLI